LIAQFGFTKEAFFTFANDSHAGDQRKYGYVINSAVCDSDDTLIVIKELINKFGIRQELINCETISQNPGTGSV